MSNRSCLRIPAGDFNVLMLCEKVIGDVVDGYAVDGNKKASEALPKRADEINDAFGCGWNRRDVVGGRKLW